MRVVIVLGLITVGVDLLNAFSPGLGAAGGGLGVALNIGVGAGQSTTATRYAVQKYGEISSGMGVGAGGGIFASGSSSVSASELKSSAHDDTISYTSSSGTANAIGSKKSESAGLGLELGLGLALDGVSKYVHSKKIIDSVGTENGTGNGDGARNNIQYHKNDFIEIVDDLSGSAESSSKPLSSATTRMFATTLGSECGNRVVKIGDSSKVECNIRHLTSESASAASIKNRNVNAYGHPLGEDRYINGGSSLEVSLNAGHASSSVSGGKPEIHISSTHSTSNRGPSGSHGGSKHTPTADSFSAEIVDHVRRGSSSASAVAGIGVPETFPISGQLAGIVRSSIKTAHNGESTHMLTSDDKMIMPPGPNGDFYGRHEGIESASQSSSFSSLSSWSTKDNFSNSQRAYYNYPSETSENSRSGSTLSNTGMDNRKTYLGGDTKIQGSHRTIDGNQRVGYHGNQGSGSGVSNESYKHIYGGHSSGGSSASGGLSAATSNGFNKDSTVFDAKVLNYGSKYDSMGRLKVNSGTSDFVGSLGSKVNIMGNSYEGQTGTTYSSENSNNRIIINLPDTTSQHGDGVSTSDSKFSGSKISEVSFGQSGSSTVELLSSSAHQQIGHTKRGPVGTKSFGTVGAGVGIVPGGGIAYGASDLYSHSKIGSTKSGIEAGIGLTANTQHPEVLSGKRSDHGRYSSTEVLKSVEISLATGTSGSHHRKKISPATLSTVVSANSGVGVGVGLGISGSTSKEITSSSNRRNSGVGSGVTLGLFGGNSRELMSSFSRLDSVASGGIGAGIGLDIGASHGTSSFSTLNSVPEPNDSNKFYSGSSLSASSSSGGSDDFTKVYSTHPAAQGSAVINHGSHQSNILGHVGGLIGDVSSNLFGSEGGSSIMGSKVHSSGLLGSLLGSHSSVHSQATASAGLFERVRANPDSSSLGRYSSGHRGSYGGSLSAGAGASAGSSSTSGLLLGGLGLGLGLGR